MPSLHYGYKLVWYYDEELQYNRLILVIND